MKKLLKLLILSALFFCSIADNLIAYDHESMTAEKIYIQPQDATATASGLFVRIEGIQYPVPSIHQDSKGIYIFKPVDSWCKNAHSTVCFECEGCSVWYCAYRCRCPD